MKTIKYLTMAALALMMIASCTNDDYELITKQPVQADGITITAQLAPKSALTRAVADNSDGKITVTWAVDEHIAVLYGSNKKADARITAVDEGVATISFTVDNGTTDNTDCTLIYPATAAKDDNSGVKTYAELLSSQDGTLNANLDVRVGSAKIQVTDPGLTDITQPEAQYSIFKFTLTTDGTTAINAKGFVVRDGSDNLITSVTPASATSSFYVAIPDKASGSAFKFIASDGTKKYTKSISTTAAIATGNYYQTPLNMGDGVALPVTDLSGITADYIATDFETLTGTLTSKVKISVEAGATVTLNNANINGTDEWKDTSCPGLSCLGNATIILNGDNHVTSYKGNHPGIYIPSGSTLTIQGPGSLTAKGEPSSGSGGAGIGGGYSISCGNIHIEGGTITASGKAYAAGIGGSVGSCGDITITGGIITATGGDGACGIGSGQGNNCGDITISDGTIIANGGNNAAGIGASSNGACGNILINGGTVTATATGSYGPGIGCGVNNSSCKSITITSGVTSVTATKATGTPNSIGAGYNSTGCGPVTILGTVYWDGSAYQNGGDTFLPTSPLYAHIPYVSGKFTINNSGDQVYFSKGNLQATTTDMGTSWTWAFAEHQWSYIGNVAANNAITGNKTVSANGTVDLFGWSTAKNYLGIHNSNDDGDYSGDFVNWGSHADVTAGIGSGWCTLSIAEWHYLFFTRSDAADKYGYATVNDVHGIIFLPDAFVDPNKNNGSDAFVGSTTGWDANVYTAENWALMEKNGAVFLPAAGYRDEADVDVDGDDGWYWSSSAYGDEEAHYVYFRSDDLVVDDYQTYRYCGHSVRLVRPVQ